MKFKLLRYIAYTLEIIVFYVLEQTPRFVPEVFGAKPLLLLPIIIMIALFEGERVALGFGILVGVLLDISFSWNLGFYAITIPILGYILGLISRNVIKNTFPTAILVSAASIFLVYTLHFLFYYIFSGFHYALYAYLFHYLPAIFYTLFTCILFYYFNKAFAAIIREDVID